MGPFNYEEGEGHEGGNLKTNGEKRQRWRERERHNEEKKNKRQDGEKAPAETPAKSERSRKLRKWGGVCERGV